MMELTNKSVLVLGLGETGLSLARWLVAEGARVRAADSRELPPALDTLRTQLPQVEIHCGAFRDELFSGIDLIAISPGVPLADPFVARAVARGIPVVGDIELFAQQLSSQSSVLNPRVIAITGANGKTTVTSMVGAMCRAAGLDTMVAGNISPAVLDALLQRNGRQPDVWVLELSSFQLETTCSLNADAATVLNVSEDHLDRYADMDAYAAAKARIFQGSGIQVLNRDDARSLGMVLPGRRHLTFGLTPGGTTSHSTRLSKNDSQVAGYPSLPLSGEESAATFEGYWGIEHDAGDIWLVHGRQRVLNSNELQVAGLHNVANALAALALCRAIGLPLVPLLDALRAFKGLPHRVEPVAKINGVIYYDDSKGTNIGATVAALQGLGRPAVLIAGGDGKGQDFTPLNPVAAQHARAVVLIGRDADRIAAALEDCGVPVVHARDMADAVRQSATLAQPGDAVLLSPACASFDMFRNYEHRAEVFVGAVHKLQTGAVCASQV